MAIGLGRMFGFEIPENFNFPYIARSIREFWRRWHISLSQWFRDYLYIPLGGNRGATGRTYLNLLIVFFLTGLWHGASWNFVVWGLFHGFFMVLERIGFEKLLQKSWAPVQHIYTLLVVMIGWVFFRAETLEYGLGYCRALFGAGGSEDFQFDLGFYLNYELLLALGLGLIASTPVFKKLDQYLKADQHRPGLQMLFHSTNTLFLLLLFLYCTMLLANNAYNPFIYFRF